MPDPADVSDGLIRVRDLRRVFTRPRTSLRRPPSQTVALDGVSFDIRRGERFGIVGESGSGKSTLLRLLCALDQPTAGSITFDGKEITGRKERELGFLRSELQIVFQDPMSSLNPRMRVRDIVCEPLVAQGRGDHDARLGELIDAVGLPADAPRRYPHQFSGGQRQRIAIARALAPRPSVLVADEPVSALDVSVQAQILNLLADLVDEFSLTLIFVAHDLEVVRHACETVTVMRRGQIVESGPTEQIHGDPQHPYTRRLIAAVPTLERALAGVGAAELAADVESADPEAATDGVLG